MPTVIFHPYFGTPNTVFGNGEKLNHTPVELIFWGSSYWNHPTGASAATIANSISTMLNGPSYQHLAQYGAGASPSYLADWWIDTDHAGPNNYFTDADLCNEIVNAINDPTAPIYPPSNFSAIPLYMVITPYGIYVNENSLPGDTGTVIGYHYDRNVHTNYGDYNLVYGWTGQPFNIGGLGGSLSNLDTITTVFSHESSEAMTDAHPFTGITPEIGDGEPESYNLDLYRVNGVLVQAMWDFNAQAYTVSDGNGQHLDLFATYHHNPDNSYTYTGSILTVYGDQLGAFYNDVVTLDTTGGGVQVTLNGQTFTFEPGIQITTINVFAGGGTNTVNVRRTLPGLAVNIQGGGNDTVNLGVNGSAQGLEGDVSISNLQSQTSTTVNVDDSNDTTARSVTVTPSAITGLAPATISYAQSSLAGLAITGGSGGNIVTVVNTPFNSARHPVTTIHTGAGNGTVNVRGTTGGLVINGDGSFETVNVGSQAPALNGTLTGITGSVTVTNTSPTSALNADDSGDTTARTGTVSSTAVTGFGMGSGGALNYAGSQLSSLTVRVRAGGGNILNVTATSTSTILDTGNQPDTVNVEATSSGLTINEGVFGAAVNVSPAAQSLANIQGGVLVNGGSSGLGNLVINDQNTFSDQTFAVGTNSVSRTGSATISFNNLVGNVIVNGGSGTDVYNVTNTNSFAHTVLHPRDAQGNTVDVRATSGPLSIPDGTATVNVGSQAPSLNGTLSTITGPITVANSGSITLNVDDSGDTVPRTGAISNGSITGLGMGPFTAINYDTNHLQGLTVQTGPGGAALNAAAVYGSNTGISLIADPSGANTLIGPGVATTWSLTGTDTGTFPVSTFLTLTYSGFQNLVGGASANHFVFADGARVSGSITGVGGANALDTSAYLSNVSFGITGANSGAASVVPVFSGIQNLVGGTAATTFSFSDGGSLAGTINGGIGTATLDYSNGWSGIVLVDLQVGRATGVIGGVSNILNVKGANGNGAQAYNLLIGNGGNRLQGGTGRSNLLVAGGSVSTLLGGDSNDLLIGGTTSYDSDPTLTAWQQIAAYWAGTDGNSDDPVTRANNLEGVNGGNGVPQLTTSTVFGNNGNNTMTGTGELALIYSDGKDTVTGFDSNSPPVYGINP